MTSLRSFLLVIGCLTALAAPTSPASAAVGDATVTVTSDVWPNPEDAGEVTVATITVQVHQAGEFDAWIPDEQGYTVWEMGERWLDVGTYVFTWDGYDSDGLPANRGVYRAYLGISLEDGTSTEEDVAGFWVHNSTETLWESDKRRERGTGDVDLDWFFLSNGPDEVEVSFLFRGRIARRDLMHATAVLDVDKDYRGYLLSVQRKGGRLVPSLTQAVLASDLPYNEAVKCRRLNHELTSRALTFTVPRSCLRIGGRNMRANYWVGRRGDRVDYGPDTGAYWTDFTRYADR